jgi:hypothetical protein
MRILLDQNTPAPLRGAFRLDHVETAYENGWAELTNGELLSAAELAGFDLLITTDKGIRHQQNLGRRRISLLVLSTNDWTRIRRCQDLIVSSVASIQSGAYIELEMPL